MADSASVQGGLHGSKHPVCTNANARIRAGLPPCRLRKATHSRQFDKITSDETTNMGLTGLWAPIAPAGQSPTDQETSHVEGSGHSVPVVGAMAVEKDVNMSESPAEHSGGIQPQAKPAERSAAAASAPVDAMKCIFSCSPGRDVQHSPPSGIEPSIATGAS